MVGKTVKLADLLGLGKPVFLVFSDSGCASCTALLPEIARWQHVCSWLTLAVVSRGTPESNRAKLVDLQVRHVLLQSDRETAELTVRRRRRVPCLCSSTARSAATVRSAR